MSDKKQAAKAKTDTAETALETPEAEAPKPGLPLFYKSPAILDAERHKEKSLKKNFGPGFAKDANAVPLNMIEMPQAAPYYPIVFTGGETATPVAILGLRDHENLFVDDKGDWLRDTYIPAYIRRYPFILVQSEDGDRFTLCIDETDDIVLDDKSQPFFDEDGQPSNLTKNAIEFCKSYQTAAGQTEEFSKAVHEAGILADRRADANLADEQRVSLSGFRVIDEEKFAQLDDKTFMEWRKKGWLPFIYAHLLSNVNWQRLRNLLNERLQAEGGGTKAAESKSASKGGKKKKK